MTATTLPLTSRLTDAFLGGLAGTVEKCFDFLALHNAPGFATATAEERKATIAEAREWIAENTTR